MQIFMGNQIELNEELNIKKSRWSFLKYHPSNQLTLFIIKLFHYVTSHRSSHPGVLY